MLLNIVSWHETGEESTHSEYKQIRNEVTEELREAKKQYFESRVNFSDSNTSWSTTI